jgi:site-specific recombinase XerD
MEELPRFDGCPYLVPNPETRLPFVSIKRAWQTARKATGLTNLRIHDLRHSAASFMINSGMDLFAVGKVLGHADYKSTMRYSHLANETLLSAVEAGASKLSAQWAA